MTDNDIYGDLPPGKLSFWKHSQYRETYDNKTRTEYYKCRLGEARSLVPPIHSSKDGLLLEEISIESHESNKVELVTLSYTWARTEDDGKEDPDNPDGDPFEFDGRESEITVTLVDEPITQCKLYKTQVDSLDNTTLKDLCALMGGQLTDEKGVDLTSKLEGKVPPSLLSKILRGQTHYKAAYTQCRLTIPSKVDITDSGQIGTRPGLPSLPEGQVWLCGGGGVTRRNGKNVTQITYIGGNWDTDIYAKK